MLQIAPRDLPKTVSVVLAKLQKSIDDIPDYPARVEFAKAEWKNKTTTKAKQAAIASVKLTLETMCVGPRRCSYCEDSLADEVEHFLPKDLFPEMTFQWSNYLFACGPCNGPKSNRYATTNAGVLTEFIRRRGEPVLPPPPGLSACLNPRTEDPMRFLDLDIGGVLPSGEHLEGTFGFIVAEGLDADEMARALFTIDVLGLNREIIRTARASAFAGFRARLREYVSEKNGGATAETLDRLKTDLLGADHLTVFAEMRRQRALIPLIDGLFVQAPEAFAWQLIK